MKERHPENNSQQTRNHNLLKTSNLNMYCGAAGNRTLVQTRNQYAFYMRSFLLVFERRTEKSTQTTP